MSEYNNEATSLNFSFRRFLIIAILPIMFAFFFNGVEVELVSNDHADFHQYSENTVSPGTSYYDDGAVQPFASAWNSLAQNVARMLGYSHLISNNTNTTNSYIATLYTYLSNNLPGQWQTLTDIKTAATNSAAANQALLQLVGDQVNIDWIDRGVGHLYDLQHNEITTQTIISNPQNYIFQFPAVSTQDLSIVKLTLPINPAGRLGNDYTFEFYDYNGSSFNKFSDPKYIYVSNVNGYAVDVYVTNIFLNYNNLCVKVIPSKGSYGFYPNINPIKIYSLNGTSEDFIEVSQYIHLHSIDNKLNDLSTDDVVQALQDLEVNVEVNDSINVTPIDLDVSIGIEDFTTVNTISNKLRTWLTTGVSVSALIGALDDLDDSFFTLSNRNTIETINNQYTNFYD